jgi:hypothetical protein
LDEFPADEAQGGEHPGERERQRKDRGEKHLMEIWEKTNWDGELVEPEDGSRDAPAKSEKQVLESPRKDGTVPFVSVSALAILSVYETDVRLRREKFREFVSLRRELPADSVTARASNYFSVRIRFV